MCIIHLARHRGPQLLIDELPRFINNSSESIINLSNLPFDRVTFPRNIFFARQISFAGSKLTNCKFDGSILTDADFSDVTFIDTYFNHCIFDGEKATFEAATFELSSRDRYDNIFNYCSFNESLTLLNLSKIEWRCVQRPFATSCVNAEIIDLSSAHFKSEFLTIGLLDENTIVSDVGVYKCIFVNPSKIDFAGIIFFGHFELGLWPGITDIAPVINLEHIDFGQMASARFIRVNLEKASFLDSDIESVTFKNVIWPKGGGGRKIVYDEIEAGKSPNYPHLESLYIQLKKLYEEHRHYSEASDWYYREMEARRRSISQGGQAWTWLRQNFFSFVPLYRYFSNYGESYIRPLIWLIGIAILAPVALLLTGISETIGDRQPDVTNYWKALTYGLGNMIFIKSEVFRAASIWSELINIIQKLSVTLFGSLFLLALRRRFRR